MDKALHLLSTKIGYNILNYLILYIYIYNQKSLVLVSGQGLVVDLS